MVIYRHLKPDGEVFYIGIGSKHRAKTKGKRSLFWNSVVEKYGYEVQILKENLSLEEAQELEKVLISWYGRRDLEKGTLVNLTDGGEGTTNLSEEAKIRNILSRNGKNRRPVICIETGRQWISINACEKDLNIKTGTLKEMLNDNNRYIVNTTSIEYLELYETNSIRPRGIKIGYASGDRNYLSKKVINTETLEIYDSVTQASKILNIKRQTLSAKLANKYKNNTSLIYYFDYLILTKQESKITELNINTKSRKDVVIEFICLNSNIEYTNLKKYCRENNINYNTVGYNMRRHGLYNKNGVNIKLN
jgi:hypothetical protein